MYRFVGWLSTKFNLVIKKTDFMRAITSNYIYIFKFPPSHYTEISAMFFDCTVVWKEIVTTITLSSCNSFS